MTPIDFEVSLSKIKVPVTRNLYLENALTLFSDLIGSFDFETSLSKVALTTESLSDQLLEIALAYSPKI